MLGAALSSTFATAYAATNLIDGNMNTVCATILGINNWASVRVAPATPVSYVAVYNRIDSAAYQAWLSPFEVWVGRAFGDTLFLCASMSVPTGAGPFLASCGGATSNPQACCLDWCSESSICNTYVTVRQSGEARYLTLAELLVCSPQTPSPPPLPPPPSPSQPPEPPSPSPPSS